MCNYNVLNLETNCCMGTYIKQEWDETKGKSQIITTDVIFKTS